ncbi:hypothetical protein CDAR_258691 [Caerostris darwini]|uniref:Uncharacterized protein n=1 Tax=Caerostris darwini TaxID=1538125 RepID=A0AAV4NMM5_9ARAC|nr:hypothetical protein CDAR_258691 [Caerostris darwini]
MNKIQKLLGDCVPHNASPNKESQTSGTADLKACEDLSCEARRVAPDVFSTKNPPQTRQKKEFVRFECPELFVLSQQGATSSLDHRNQNELTRDNRHIPDDICLPSSTNRDLFPSNDQMSPTRGFSLSINKQQKQCF